MEYDPERIRLQRATSDALPAWAAEASSPQPEERLADAAAEAYEAAWPDAQLVTFEARRAEGLAAGRQASSSSQLFEKASAATAEP